jgi:hypothetical protein
MKKESSHTPKREIFLIFFQRWRSTLISNDFTERYTEKVRDTEREREREREMKKERSHTPKREIFLIFFKDGAQSRFPTISQRDT